MRQPPSLKKEQETSNGFSRSSYDSCVYFKEFAPGMYIYLLLYVDDMLIACKSKSEIEYTKGLLRKEFDIKELGPAKKILGMEIVRDRGSQTLKTDIAYVVSIVRRYLANSRNMLCCELESKNSDSIVVALSTTEAEYMGLRKLFRKDLA
ncbi:retrovirus-related pol polyprotein from transposon TNT 1-94 [Tanacetum coccineum]